MAADAPQQVHKPTTRHRREARLQIWLPLAFGLLIIIACLVAVLLLPRRAQVGLVGDLLLIVFMLCPLALCLLPLTLLLVAGVLGMNQGHTALAKPLRRLEDLSHTAAEKTAETAEKINTQTIAASARLGLLYHWMGIFDERPLPDEEKHDSDNIT